MLPSPRIRATALPPVNKSDYSRLNKSVSLNLHTSTLQHVTAQQAAGSPTLSEEVHLGFVGGSSRYSRLTASTLVTHNMGIFPKLAMRSKVSREPVAVQDDVKTHPQPGGEILQQPRFHKSQISDEQQEAGRRPTFMCSYTHRSLVTGILHTTVVNIRGKLINMWIRCQ